MTSQRAGKDNFRIGVLRSNPASYRRRFDVLLKISAIAKDSADCDHDERDCAEQDDLLSPPQLTHAKLLPWRL